MTAAAATAADAGESTAQASTAVVARPPVVWAVLAALCAAGVAVVAAVGGPSGLRTLTMVTVGAQAAGCAAVAWLYRGGLGRHRPLAIALVLTVAALTAVPGYHFGPSSGFAAVCALVLVTTGVIGGAELTRAPAGPAWATYGVIAGGQALVLTLVLAGALADRSLTVVLVPGHPLWQHAAAHGALQAIYLVGFVAGRRYQRAYRRLASELEVAQRAAARRDALLAEARAEYARALAIGKDGVLTGQTLGGFALGPVLDRGGVAEVYEAVSPGSEQAVAVKVLRTDRLGDPEAVARFVDETAVARRVTSPHVARVVASGDGSSPLPFLAMEKLEGQDLATLVRAHGRLPAAELRGLATALAAALEAVHGAGVLHLDVTPRNVMRVAGGWKLVDFGAAQLAAAQAPDAGAMGTLRYFAPERLRGVVVERAADVYGMMATLYTAACGEEPYGEIDPALLTGVVLTRMPRRPDAVSEALAEVLAIGLARAPEARFATVGEAAAAVTRALDGEGATEAGPFDSAPRLRSALRSGRAGEGTVTVTVTEAGPFDSAPRLRSALRSGPAGEETGTGTEVGPFDSAPRLRSALRSGRAGEETGTGTEVEMEAETAMLADPTGSSDLEGPASDAGALSASRTSDARRTAAAPQPLAARLSTDEAPAWQAAYQTKMRGFHAAVTALCAGGATLLGLIITDRTALWLAWACITGIVATVLLHRALTRKSADGSVYWPWAIIGALSVGPAYALGLHSGFAAVLTVILFAGGMFRAALASAWLDRRGLVLAAVLVAHTTAFVLIERGVLADGGNLPIAPPGAPASRPWIFHLLLCAVYAGAFAAGAAVDRRQRALVRRNQAAAAIAARQEALLATARAQLEAALAGEQAGIFSTSRLGRYDLGRLLGRGGMGEVYEARDRDSGARVALKVVRADRVADPLFLRRFTDEARALARVDSRFVARVVDAAGLDRELPYIAMELVDGPSLADVLRGRPGERLPAAEVAQLVADAAAALADVHAAGVVHRDLKPHNLVRTTDAAGARWRLVDLGLAQLDGGSDTTSRLVAGTPAYMAPEQVLGAGTDHRADLYSLGLVVYRALVGRPAFTGRDPLAIARAALDRGPPDPGLPPDDEVGLCLRLALAASPTERFASAAELAEAFAAAFAGRLAPALRERARAQLTRAPWA